MPDNYISPLFIFFVLLELFTVLPFWEKHTPNMKLYHFDQREVKNIFTLQKKCREVLIEFRQDLTCFLLLPTHRRACG